jgi:hypothetical protein
MAQITAFNFQGRLNDGTSSANGPYDFQFKLFDAIVGGSQVGPTLTRPDLLLINGVFSTSLDFGLSPFTGGDRFIEISVRPVGSPNPRVILGARQQMLSVPYAVRATNASNADSLGGLPAFDYARLNFLNTGNLQTAGNVGFGTVAPNTRLTLSGGPPWTSSGWTASMNLQNASAIGWEANGSGQRFGVGQSTDGLYFFRTYAGFGQTVPPPQIDLQITDNGNIAQPVERNGLIKAMVAITANGTVARCYNGVTGSTVCSPGFGTNGCIIVGQCLVTLPIQVSNRFWLVVPDSSSTTYEDQITASVGPTANSRVLEVFLWKDGSHASLPFHLFVF